MVSAKRTMKAPPHILSDRRLLPICAALLCLGCSTSTDRVPASVATATLPAAEPDIMALVEASPRLVHEMIPGIRGGPFAIDIAGDQAVVHGGCPFECCRYGDWRLEGPAVLRRRPYSFAPEVARLPANFRVFADSGLVILDSIGLAVVQRDTVDYAPPPGVVLNDTSQIHHFARGDTIRILDGFGEGAWRIRWHGTSNDQMEEVWDTTATAAIRLVREPHWHWWAHIVSDAGALSGWIETEKVEITGADACGGSAPSHL